MIAIEIQDSQVLAYLDRLGTRLADMTPALDAIGQRLEERIAMRFETETDPAGKPWAPWAEATRKTYPKDAHRHVLDRYGDMLRSLNHQADRDSVRVGFGQPYAAYHEWGTQHMPRRGLLSTDPAAGTLGEEDQASILDILSTYLAAE